jgi:hypothetical protein
MRQSNMTNGKNDVEELEELLTELEQEGALVAAPYSEEDDVVTQLMEAPLDDQQWLVQITALDRRMLTSDQLLSELRIGQLVNEQTLVWRGGMDEWVPIAQVAELLGGPALVQTPRSGVVQLPPPPVPIPPPVRMGSNTARFPLPPDARLTPVPPSSALGLPLPPAPNPWVPAPPSSALGLPPPPPPAPPPVNPMHGMPTVPAGLLPPLAPVPAPPSSAVGPAAGGEASSTLLSAQLPKSASSEPDDEDLSAETEEPEETEEPSPAAELPPAALAPTLVRRGKAASQGSAAGAATGPVSADFSELSPPRGNPVRLLLGSGVAALIAILGTSYALSSAGVFEAPALEAAAPQSREVSSLQPTTGEVAPGSTGRAPAAAAAPASEPTPEAAAVAPAVAEAVAAEPAPEPANEKADEAAAEESAAAAPAPEEPAPSESVTARKVAQPAADVAAASTATARASDPSPAESRSQSRRPNRGAAEPAEAPSAAATKPKRRSTRASESAGNAPVSVVSSAPAEAIDDDASKNGTGSTFNRDAAKAALDGAATQVKNCRPQGGPSGGGSVQLRYEPSGKVSAVSILTPKFENTTTGDCIVMLFRRANVPAFSGAPMVVMNKNFEIP